MKRLEGEIANMVDTIALGIRSQALLTRLQAAEAELEQLKASTKVIDIQEVMAAVQSGVARYRERVAQMGSKKAIDIEQAREVIKSMADSIPVRPGADGVPVAELSLNEETPLAQVAGGGFQIGVGAGAGFEPATFGL